MFSTSTIDPASLDKFLKTCGGFANLKYRIHPETHQSKIRELAMIVCASAKRLGVSDQQQIFTLIKILVDAAASDITGFIHEKGAQAYLREFSDLIQTFKTCDVDCLLYHLFQEMNDPKKVAEMANRLISLNTWRANINDLPDWIGIYRLLSDDKLVLEYMDQLEEELQQSIAKLPSDWQLPRRADGKFELPDNSPRSCYKLVSNFMYQWASENGFAQSAKLIREVSTPTFYRALASQSIIKDSDFGGAHGIFVHAKQWYVVVEHYKKTWFLKSSPLEIYKRLGSANLVKSDTKYADNPWDILFDTLKENCTSPEKLTGYMSRDERRWPLLGGSINRHRLKKRTRIQSKLLAKHAHEEKNGVVFRPFRAKL